MKKTLMLDGALTRMKLFRSVKADILKEAEKSCRCVRAARKQILLSYGEHSDQVYFILHGAVRCLLHSANGRVLSMADLGVGDMFGDFAAIDGQPRSVDVVALADTMLVVMPAATFREILYRHDDVAREVLQSMSQRMRLLTDRMVERSTLEVGGRLRSELLRIAGAHAGKGRTATFPAPRHAELAARIGANREAVTRELVKLTREGWLETRQGQCVIRDIDKFRNSLVEMGAGIATPTEAAP